MKKLFLFIVLIGFVSCKTKSNIITSKEEAKAKGLYNYKDVVAKYNSGFNASDTKNRSTDYSEDTSMNSGNKVSKSSNNLANKIVESALENLGVAYKTGGTTKKGMDCSGLIYSTYLNNNVTLPRTSNDMSFHGEMISTKEAQPGDLIFFMTNGKKVVNHVGLIIEVSDDEIKFIHSSTSKGVIISSTLDDYYGKTFAQINRVLNY